MSFCNRRQHPLCWTLLSIRRIIWSLGFSTHGHSYMFHCYWICFRALPLVCQVTDPALQDAFLASDYSLLPPLKWVLIYWHSLCIYFLPHVQCWCLKFMVQCTWWNGTSCFQSLGRTVSRYVLWVCINSLFLMFSSVSNWLFLSFYSVALATVWFIRYKNFINPSRVSPLDVNIFYTTHDRKRSLLQCNLKTAICLSPILSRDSYLLTPTSFGLRNKYISGHFHSQEWQCFEAFATTVFDKPVMTAQLYNDALSFVTMGPGKGKSSYVFISLFHLLFLLIKIWTFYDRSWWVLSF